MSNEIGDGIPAHAPPPPVESPPLSDIEQRLADSIARGIRAQQEAQGFIGVAADPRGPDVPYPSDPYNPTDPLYNTIPAANNVTYDPPVGGAPLWKQERVYLLTNAREQDAPFVAGVVIPGMNEPLTPEDADFLNERYPT